MRDDVRQPEALPVLRRRSLASRVKPYLRDIDRQVEDGAPLEEAIAALAQKGIEVSKFNLKQMLYRERKVWRASASPSDGPTQVTTPGSAIAVPRPLAEIPAAQAAVETSDERFAAALDPKKRAEHADKYTNTRAPLFAAKAQGEKS